MYSGTDYKLRYGLRNSCMDMELRILENGSRNPAGVKSWIQAELGTAGPGILAGKRAAAGG